MGMPGSWSGEPFTVGRYGSLFAPADVTGADLTEVADGLLTLPTGN
jgi:hypothetical protein